MTRGLSNHFDRHERRLVLRSALVGAVVWAVVFTLKTAVHELEHFTLNFLEETSVVLLAPYLIGFLIAGALIVALISRFGSTIIHYRDDSGHIHELIDVEGDGLERAISLYYASEPTFEQSLLGAEGVDVRWKMPSFSLAARKFVATLATLGSGGSGGLEASVTLIGESLAAGIFKPRFKKGSKYSGIFGDLGRSDPDDLQTAQLSGIAAAVATLLGAPFMAAFFATEVMYRRRPIIEKLVYSLISALVAFFLNTTAPHLLNQTPLATQFGIHFENKPIFHIETVSVPPLTNWRYILLVGLMCIVIALIATQFARLRSIVDEWFHKRQENIFLRHVTGASVTGLIALSVFFGLRAAAAFELFGIGEHEVAHALPLVLGTGEGAIDSALNGELILAVALIALVARVLATLSTIGSGGSAGLLVPSLFFGTMIATVFVQAPVALGLSEFQFEASQIIIPAMAASLVAIVNVPLAAILFVIEAFGSIWIIPALIAMVVSNIFAFNISIYRTQREGNTQRQILPGYSVHRLPIPEKWGGETLASLNMRRRFNVNVIGWLEYEAADGLPHVRLSADAHLQLQSQDILVVLGKDEDLKKLVQAAEGDEPLPPAETIPSASPSDEIVAKNQQSDADSFDSNDNKDSAE
ncbi:MAG: CIC family chloride channel protein [Cellvibrionaceae bacterium]|jgi:CIC family chloride channel protein